MLIEEIKNCFYTIEYELSIPTFIEMLELAIHQTEISPIEIFIEPAAVGILILSKGQFPEDYLERMISNAKNSANEEFILMLNNLELYADNELRGYFIRIVQHLVNYLFLKDEGE